MREKTCCFTGHRKLLVPENIIKNRLSEMLDNLIKNGVIYFGAGGALGFDTLAAEVVLEKKCVYPQIKLILVLPCIEQTKEWSSIDIDKYNYILSQADKVVYTSQKYYRGCMHKRNRHLVDNSSHCVCYLENYTGGTAYTVGYADKNGLKIYNMAATNYMEEFNV